VGGEQDERKARVLHHQRHTFLSHTLSLSSLAFFYIPLSHAHTVSRMSGKHVGHLTNKHHVYCTFNGRFSMAGVNPGNSPRNPRSAGADPVLHFESRIPNPESRIPTPETPSTAASTWPTLTPVPKPHRGTSLTRKRTPLGPYRRPMLRVLGGS